MGDEATTIDSEGTFDCVYESFKGEVPAVGSDEPNYSSDKREMQYVEYFKSVTSDVIVKSAKVNVRDNDELEVRKKLREFYFG